MERARNSMDIWETVVLTSDLEQHLRTATTVKARLQGKRDRSHPLSNSKLQRKGRQNTKDTGNLSAIMGTVSSNSGPSTSSRPK